MMHTTIMTIVAAVYMANPTHTLLIANAKSAEYIHARSHINMDSRHNIRSTSLQKNRHHMIFTI